MYAVTLAHRIVPPFAPLHIVSDSKYVIEGLTIHLPKWERRGWIGVANADVVQETVALLRSRSARTTFRWVKGHAGIEGNEEADKLAGKASTMLPAARPLFPLHPTKYLQNGATLAYLTQRMAYKGILMERKREERRSTVRNLAKVKVAIRELTGRAVREATIWKCLRNEAVARKTRDFLWKVLHDAYKVGAFWENIPGYETRAVCKRCGVCETMEHILMECSAPGQRTAWGVAKELLGRKGVELGEVRLGLALGGQAVDVLDSNGKVRVGATRLLRIIVSETARCIWVLRCERVIAWEDIPEKSHSDDEITNRVTAALTSRLTMDCSLANMRKLGRKTPSKNVVLATWSGVLQNEEDLPEDWTRTKGVLVGKPARIREPD